MYQLINADAPKAVNTLSLMRQNPENDVTQAKGAIMTNIEIIHNPKCSKSRAALELLNHKGLIPEVTEYLQKPLSAEQLEKISSKLGLKPSQFVRKGEYSKLGIEMAETEKGIVRQMVEHPILIERPIVINGDNARIGRPTESILEII